MLIVWTFFWSIIFTFNENITFDIVKIKLSDLFYVYSYYNCLNYFRKVNSGDYCVCVSLHGAERVIIEGKFCGGSEFLPES